MPQDPSRPAHGKFHHFTDVLANVKWFVGRGVTAPPAVKRALAAFGFGLTVAQRFYMPDAARVLAGRRLDAETKRLFKLPYDAVAVLSEASYDPEPGEVGDDHKGWMLSLAFMADSRFNREVRLVATDRHLDGFILMGANLPTNFGPVLPTAPNDWQINPLPVACRITGEDEGVFMRGVVPPDSDFVKEADVPALLSASEHHLANVLNLCVMLSLHNVSATTREPPGKVQSKRQSRGKPPLYSYKVLTVDGQAWDAPDRSTGPGEGPGVRSHMRRGHIRRLHGGEKRVWVRATYVHGSVPGFVDKDYRVKVPA